MNATELARMVRDVRAAQNAYFTERNSANLARSKELEKNLDRAVAEILSPQPTLPFDVSLHSERVPLIGGPYDGKTIDLFLIGHFPERIIFGMEDGTAVTYIHGEEVIDDPRFEGTTDVFKYERREES